MPTINLSINPLFPEVPEHTVYIIFHLAIPPSYFIYLYPCLLFSQLYDIWEDYLIYLYMVIIDVVHCRYSVNGYWMT